MDAAAEPGEPPEQVAVPGFAFIWTAEKTDTFCSLCGHPLVKGLDMAKLDDGAAKDGALRCFYPPKGNSAWSHVACFATTHVWRARAGLEAPQQRPAWKTPVVASRSRNLCVGPAYWRPSEEQVGAYRWVAHGSGSAVVVARAGSGKTATLAAAMTLVEAARCNYPRSFAALYNNPLVLAFNRHNQADLVRVISPFTAEVRQSRAAVTHLAACHQLALTRRDAGAHVPLVRVGVLAQLRWPRYDAEREGQQDGDPAACALPGRGGEAP